MTSLGPIDKRVPAELMCHTFQCFFVFFPPLAFSFLGPSRSPRVSKVEVWLNRVLDSMRATVRHEMTEAVAAYEDKPREQWLFDYPAQVNPDGFRRQLSLSRSVAPPASAQHCGGATPRWCLHICSRFASGVSTCLHANLSLCVFMLGSMQMCSGLVSKDEHFTPFSECNISPQLRTKRYCVYTIAR